MLEQRFEDRNDVRSGLLQFPRSRARPAAGVEHREIQRLIIRAQFHKQLEHFVEHLVRAGILAIDLVDDDDRPQLMLEGFLEHEPRLRHRSLGRIDQQKHAVRHRQHALHFPAEICVAGRVDQVDLGGRAGRIGVGDGDVLGENGDSTLALQGIAVEQAFLRELAITKIPALPEQSVHQRRLAMVDVGDNCNISNIVSHCIHNRSQFPRTGSQRPLTTTQSLSLQGVTPIQRD
jgi:hypothetical protein